MKTILLIALILWLFLFSGCAGYSWVGEPGTFRSMGPRPIWVQEGTIWVETDESKNKVKVWRR